MKRETWLTLQSGALLAFLLSFSCALCMTTAFDLLSSGLVDLKALVISCALVSLFCSSFNAFRFGGIVIAVLLAAFGAYLWFYDALETSVEALCETISTHYNNGYHWGILRWSAADLQTADRTMALQLIGAFVAMITSWIVCRKRAVIWAIIASLPPLVCCTILTTTVPTKKALFLWLLAILLLLMTQPARIKDAKQANKLTLYIFLPAVAALMLLFWLIPQEGYSHAAQADRMLQRVEALFDGSGVIAGTGHTDVVDLTRVGRMAASRLTVMDVTAPTTDAYYLRGRAFDVYTGTQWLDSGVNSNLPWQQMGQGLGRITIRTRTEEDVLYLPYYTDFMASGQANNVLWNTGGITEYSFDCYAANCENSVNFASETDMQAMTALPDTTRQWAEARLAEILQEDPAASYDGAEATAQKISDYLKNYAEYDLNTPRMDSEYTDFAYWFLTVSDSGYCVHYATSAVVLLRAAGIPARYVTGFLIDGVEGETVSVPQKNAHAWVEYWTAAYGWRILDPTPAASEETPTQTTEAPTEETTEGFSASQETSAATELTEENTASSSVADGTSTQGQAENTHNFIALFQALRWILLLLLIFFLLIGQWKLRVFLRSRARQRGTTNARALRCWRQATLYARVLGEKPEPALRDLALKAKFSDHALTAEELKEFECYFRHAISALRTKPLILRLTYRLVLALY